MKKYWIFYVLMFAFVLGFSQKRKPKVIYAPPVIAPEKEESGINLDVPPPFEGGWRVQSSGDIGVVMGESISNEEIIRNLNTPFRKDTFPAKVRVFMDNADKLVSEQIGATYFQQYLRINRSYIYDLDKSYWRYKNLKRYDSFVGVRLIYTVVYQGFILGDINVKMDTLGKVFPQNKTTVQSELAAYKELFEGKLKVSPAEVVKALFGTEKPTEIYHLSLFHSGARTPKFYSENDATYKKPKIWWDIWQNGCNACKEGEIDAYNFENHVIKTVVRH